MLNFLDTYIGGVLLFLLALCEAFSLSLVYGKLADISAPYFFCAINKFAIMNGHLFLHVRAAERWQPTRHPSGYRMNCRSYSFLCSVLEGCFC